MKTIQHSKLGGGGGGDGKHLPLWISRSLCHTASSMGLTCTAGLVTCMPGTCTLFSVFYFLWFMVSYDTSWTAYCKSTLEMLKAKCACCNVVSRLHVGVVTRQNWIINVISSDSFLKLNPGSQQKGTLFLHQQYPRSRASLSYVHCCTDSISIETSSPVQKKMMRFNSFTSNLKLKGKNNTL